MLIGWFGCLWVERRKECEGVSILSTAHSDLSFLFCSQKTNWESVVESTASKQYIEDACGKGWSFSWKIYPANFDQQLQPFFFFFFKKEHIWLRKFLLTTVLNIHCRFWKISFSISYLLGKILYSSIDLKTVYISCFEYFETLSEFR